jgi:hypothetical protein
MPIPIYICQFPFGLQSFFVLFLTTNELVPNTNRRQPKWSNLDLFIAKKNHRGHSVAEITQSFSAQHQVLGQLQQTKQFVPISSRKYHFFSLFFRRFVSPLLFVYPNSGFFNHKFLPFYSLLRVFVIMKSSGRCTTRSQSQRLSAGLQGAAGAAAAAAAAVDEEEEEEEEEEDEDEGDVDVDDDDDSSYEDRGPLDSGLHASALVGSGSDSSGDENGPPPQRRQRRTRGLVGTSLSVPRVAPTLASLKRATSRCSPPHLLDFDKALKLLEPLARGDAVGVEAAFALPDPPVEPGPLQDLDHATEGIGTFPVDLDKILLVSPFSVVEDSFLKHCTPMAVSVGGSSYSAGMTKFAEASNMVPFATSGGMWFATEPAIYPLLFRFYDPPCGIPSPHLNIQSQGQGKSYSMRAFLRFVRKGYEESGQLTTGRFAVMTFGTQLEVEMNAEGRVVSIPDCAHLEEVWNHGASSGSLDVAIQGKRSDGAVVVFGIDGLGRHAGHADLWRLWYLSQSAMSIVEHGHRDPDDRAQGNRSVSRLVSWVIGRSVGWLYIKCILF